MEWLIQSTFQVNDEDDEHEKVPVMGFVLTFGEMVGFKAFTLYWSTLSAISTPA